MPPSRRKSVPPVPATPEPEPDLAAEYADPYEGMEFTSYDPTEQVQIPDGMPQGGPDDAEPQLQPFDERYRDDFEGLMFLGALSVSFSYVGHKFTMRTLTTLELLAVGRVIKHFEETIGANRAYATAMVALSLQKVDGKELPIPYAEGEDPYEWAEQRFQYVAARWYPMIIDELYTKYNLLEARVREVLEEMAKKV